MTVPSHDELMNPILLALRKLGKSASISELTEQVLEDLAFPEAVIRQPHGKGNISELEYRLAWARTYLKKFGVITNSDRGVWALTAEGTSTERVDPREVVRFVQQQNREGATVTRESPEVTGIDANRIDNYDDETALWREELLETLLRIQPKGFERLCQRMLRESGFIEVEVTGSTGDGGIDGHGIIRVAGLISFPVLFQCKRYRDNVGSNMVRDFRGAMIGRADKGLIITTGGFTRDARLEATRDGAPPVDLIDGTLLTDKLKELRLGIRTKMVEVVEVDKEWYSSI